MENKEVTKKELSHSERFTIAVQREFMTSAGELTLTAFQKKLIQNYFIKLDQVLKESERKRLAKNEQYREVLPYTWENVNMVKLSTDVVAFSSVGLDPTQPNHINLIPYKNNSSNKYDINMMVGYVGLELKAKKYGFDVPDDVVIEIVYSTDKFKQYKKDNNNDIEGYDFEVTNEFDRGEIVGGFYYKIYNDSPSKNKLRVFSKHDLDKRIPSYASVEFWGGEKDVWKDGQKVGKEEVEGWKDEMYNKMLRRAAFNSIPIDSEKIDEHLLKIIDESNKTQYLVEDEVKTNANKNPIDFEDAEFEKIDDSPKPEDKTQNQERNSSSENNNGKPTMDF